VGKHESFDPLYDIYLSQGRLPEEYNTKLLSEILDFSTFLKTKERSTKHTHKTKDRVIRTPLKTGGELRWSGRVGSIRSTSDIRRVTHKRYDLHL
jgi:hypothetical protein